MRMTRAASAPQPAQRCSSAWRFPMCRDREPLHFDPFDPVGVPFILRTRCQLLLLRTEETWGVRRPDRLIEIARPKIVGLHHVEGAVEDQIAFACHLHRQRVCRLERIVSPASIRETERWLYRSKGAE